jgi:hypothetical protein
MATLLRSSRLICSVSRQGYADADIVLMMTTVGLTSEAMLVSGGVINPNENDLGRLHDILRIRWAFTVKLRTVNSSESGS